MIKVVGVRFKKAGKIYYFNPNEIEIKKDDNVIVETARGIEFGECVIGPKEIDESEIVAPLKSVLRVADIDDIARHEDNKSREKHAFEVCFDKITEHKLNMKLIDVEYTFDNNKVIFYFTADGRVDFRELVKDLATIFKTRIELRQIGVRDEAKMIGGLGPCGRSLCCSTFLGDFASVSIKMAKEQNLSLNPTKISGICGRLMCCLNYEQNTYEDIRKRLPKIGSVVETELGRGEVISNSVVKEKVKVKLFRGEEDFVEEFKIENVKLISGGYEGTVDDHDIKLELDDDIDKKMIKDLFSGN
ncbi:PSP1 domain-containing protein [Clostridium folliculivorans]|uniref:Stage 0 sporulation protein n=1 Tax=Clostridium folliculivorans TaxID=2886038 RepID=A0A9W5Y8G4_9CLOT|nr:stage 0 sporulation family protein [Clostridium folliculivorans]GKU27732.1 stage 0 sporulation protein [Clostridium folliculivorans]GKU32532.1 stage 0 sporulation protein [Clostridium folliculivorans]